MMSTTSSVEGISHHHGSVEHCRDIALGLLVPHRQAVVAAEGGGKRGWALVLDCLQLVR